MKEDLKLQRRLSSLLYCILSVKELICKNHREIKFSIPENIEECISLNSFQVIKSCELHLEKNPNCKLIEWSDSD